MAGSSGSLALLAGACCKIAVVRIGYFSFGGIVVGQIITDHDEK